MLSAAAISTMAYGMIVFGVGVLITLVSSSMKATYGRYAGETGKLSARLAWFLQELPAFAIPFCLIIRGDCATFGWNVNTVVLLMFITHYAQRTFVFSYLIRGGKQTPIHIMLSAVGFCVYNGYMQSVHHCQYADYSQDYGSMRRILGLSLFIIGFAINIHSDHVLRTLRKPGETGYKIPQGGLFTYVSGANFTGEIIEWIGYALFANSLPAWAFAICTVCNIGPRAFDHHQWYLEKFYDYPKERKALIPFIW